MTMSVMCQARCWECRKSLEGMQNHGTPMEKHECTHSDSSTQSRMEEILCWVCKQWAVRAARGAKYIRGIMEDFLEKVALERGLGEGMGSQLTNILF